MTEKAQAKDLFLRVTGNLKFEIFLPFCKNFCFQAPKEDKNGNLTFTVVNIEKTFNANQKDINEQQQEHDDIDIAIANYPVIKNSMILNFEDYEMTQVIDPQNNKSKLKIRIWERICEHFNITEKFVRVWDNFENINNIYIPAQFTPFALSMPDSSRLILLTPKDAGELRSFIYDESDKLQIYTALLLKSGSANFLFFKNIFIQNLNGCNSVSLYFLTDKNKLYLKSFLEKAFPQLNFEFQRTPLAITTFEHQKSIESKTMFFINRKNKEFEILLGYRKCFHTLTKTSKVFHEKITKMMVNPKEIGESSILNYCSRLDKYRDLIGYCIEIVQNSTWQEAIRLITLIVERANGIWLEKRRRQQCLNNRNEKVLVVDGEGIGESDSENDDNKGDSDVNDTLTVAFVTHDLEKLQDILTEPLIYGEEEIKKDIKQEKKVTQLEKRFWKTNSDSTDPYFVGINRTLDFYYKIFLFCQNLKKDCDWCFRQSRGNRLFNTMERQYFRICEGYIYRSNPSSDEKSQLGVECPLNERIFVNFIMEDGTRKCFSNEILKIRLCCIFDALQKGVWGVNFTNPRYHNLIRDFRILWPLKEELKLNNRRYPVYNEKEKCYKLNSFKNLDILLI